MNLQKKPLNNVKNRIKKIINYIKDEWYFKIQKFNYRIIRKEVKLQYSFILPFLLSKIDWTENVKVEAVGDSYFLCVGVLSLIALSCFYNVMAYFLSLYLLQRYNIKEKYPKLNSILYYYEKTGFIYVIVECITCVIALLMLCVTGFLLYYKISFS